MSVKCGVDFDKDMQDGDAVGLDAAKWCYFSLATYQLQICKHCCHQIWNQILSNPNLMLTKYNKNFRSQSNSGEDGCYWPPDANSVRRQGLES